MMLTAMAVLLGATMVWRGRVANATDAASLRSAVAAVNRQVLVLAVMFLAALLPALRVATDGWLVTSLGVAGVFALVLFTLRARWQNRARESWESAVQANMLRTLMPPAPVVVMPVAPIRLRDAA
jgi:hypothetical protein